MNEKEYGNKEAWEEMAIIRQNVVDNAVEEQYEDTEAYT